MGSSNSAQQDKAVEGLQRNVCNDKINIGGITDLGGLLGVVTS